MKMLELFIDEKIAGQSEKSAKVYISFYKRVKEYIPENKSPNEFTVDDYKLIFKKLNIKTVGNFKVVKSNLADYFKWLVSKDLMSNEQLEEFLKISFKDIDHIDEFALNYFKNFNELFTSLEKAIEIHSPDDKGEFDSLRCAVYLSWFGVTVEELCEVLKEDINKSTNSIMVGNPKREIVLPDKCFRKIVEYAKSDYYESKKFGRPVLTAVHYKPSIYLFRTCRNSQISYNQVMVMFKYVNRYFEITGKKFSCGKIYRSGIYYRIYQDEQDNGELLKHDFERLFVVFNKSDEAHKKNKKYELSSQDFIQYQEWKNVFYK